MRHLLQVGLVAVCMVAFTTPIKAVSLNGLVEKYKYDFTLLGYIKVFSASLYASSEVSLIEFPGEYEFALRFDYHRNISRRELVKRGNAALEAQFDSETLSAFGDELTEINAAYENVGKGDFYTLRFKPEEGLILFRNENSVLAIENDAFAKFYLSIWLGESTPNQSIRKSLIPTPE